MPTALADALQRQGIEPETAGGPFDALSRLLVARRGGARGRVLVLVEPAALGDHDSVRRAVARFDPEARCWAYEASASPRLSPMLPPSDPVPEVVVRPTEHNDRSLQGQRASRPPVLKLTGEGPVGSKPPEHDADREEGASESPRSMLTAEELEMLLADDQQDRGR